VTVHTIETGTVLVTPTLASPTIIQPSPRVNANPTFGSHQIQIELEPPPSPTALSTVTTGPIYTNTPLLTQTNIPPSPTQTPIPPCSERTPVDNLLTLVTLEFGLSRDYVPNDLVPLSDYFPRFVTKGYPTKVREVVVHPLSRMFSDMHAAGLNPTIISGFRNYSAQAIARNKWLEQEPDRVSILSAPPGHSEHQLGTTVDFGSPELPFIVNQEDIEFHTYFYKSSEGQWLTEHAHEYGFTLSYPRESLDLTGFYYEPWHYRYIGIDLAAELNRQNTTLTEHLLSNKSPPCIP
jgi:D-alanyl-D-alanine carboxypeptidase